MRRSLLLLFVMILCASLAYAQNTPVKVIYPTKMDISPPLRELAQNATRVAKTGGQDREMRNILPGHSKFKHKGGGSRTPDQTLQEGGATENAAGITLNFDGASNNDNQIVIGGRVAPPDPNMDVGPNHIVQTINLVSTIWNKSGTLLQGPFATSDLWTGFGGSCEINNDGDPIVVYDHLADRWLISQFVFSSTQCMAISTTPDPTGSYFRYAFSTPGNDYPKIGMMPDAYYATIRNFSGAFNMDAVAMDRAKMLAGDPSATIQIFNLSALNPDCEGVQPVDLDGPAPPGGTPGIFAGNNCGPSLVHNQIDIFNMSVDFANPGNSTLTGPSTVNVSQFDLNQANIPQPAGPSLDDLSSFTMYRVGFRDFGTGNHFAMVLNHTVDVNDFANHAGIRWYELRDNSRTGAGGSWTLFQEGTYAPDSDHRWMAGIAMNANGDIGLSYTVSSSSTSPSIRVTGRLAGDPPGVMTLPETSVIAGTGSQTGTSRWGDYSSLSVDPSNDVTFVGTHEYVQTTGTFNWWTRIFSFDVTPPGPTPPTITSTPNTVAFVNAPYSYDPDNTVDVSGTPPITFSSTGPAGFTVNATTGVVSWTPTAADIGMHPVSITATNAQGFDTQNFTIEVKLYEARINSGGPNYTALSGDVFVADVAYSPPGATFGFVGGSTFNDPSPVGNTNDDPLYQALRGHAQSFQYKFDVPDAGNYDVTLHFQAPVFGAGNFIMDISAEGGLVFNDLDIETETGGTNLALIKNFTANVSDGTLDLDFQMVNKAVVVMAIEVVQVVPVVGPEIDVTPLALNFGQVEVGQFADLIVNISNIGTAALTVSQLNVTNGVFTLVSPPATPFTVAPGGTQAITVRFSPTAVGNQTGNLEIVSDDADEPSVNVSLDGEGITQPAGDVFRINAAGPQYTALGGDVFIADQAYTAGSIGYVGGNAFNDPSPIGGTADDPLYQTIRGAGAPGFEYRFDVTSAGTFDVTLHFQAPQFGVGNFVMDVSMEGSLVFNNLDLETESGGTNQALAKIATVTVNDGILNINFVTVNKASIVSAIEVVQQPAAPNLAKSAPSEELTIASVPTEFQLFQNHPNPFNPSTSIRYSVPEDMNVTIKIYNMLGEEIRTLVSEYNAAGSYIVQWNARSDSGTRVPSGVYIYRLEGKGFAEMKKMILLQ